MSGQPIKARTFPPIALAMSSFDADELARRRAHITAAGLPCVVVGVVIEGDFASIVLEPAEGWTHLTPEDALAEFAAAGYVYHISLGYGVDPNLVAEIHARWTGVTTIVGISWVRDSNVAMLSWSAGLGADPSIWAALAQGYPNRSFGLHISM